MKTQSDRSGQGYQAPARKGYVRRQEGELVAYEIGAYGFTVNMRSVLIGWGSMAILIFPLGVMGVMLGLQANDWEAAIRTAAIGFGTAGVVASISPFVWLISKAFLWRESIHVGPGGARVRRGLLWDRWEQSDLAGASARMATRSDEPKPPDYEPRGRICLATENSRVCFGGALPASEQRRLINELNSVLSSWKAGDGGVQELSIPLGTRIATGTRGLLSAVVAPFRRPVPYLACDLATILFFFALPKSTLPFDPFEYYPYFFGAFVVGLVLRGFDDHFLSGLQYYLRKNPGFPVIFAMAGFFIGLGGALAGIKFHRGWLTLIVPVTVCVGLHLWLVKRAGKRLGSAKPKRGMGIDVLAGLTLIPIAIAHEHASFLFFEDTSKRYFILALPLVLPVVLAVYWPIRMHYFVDSPRDKSNHIWFWITVVLMAIYAVFGVGYAS